MGQILDRRETVKGLHRLARRVCESVGERWRDGAGSLLTIGFRWTPPMFCTHVHGKFVEKRRWGLATLISNLPGILLKGPFRGLPVNVQLVPHHMHAHNPTVRVELEERTNLDLPRRTLTRPWGRCWQGGSARGTTDERKHRLAAIGYGG